MESKPKILLSFVGNRDPLALKPCLCEGGKEPKERDGIFTAWKKFLPWLAKSTGASASNSKQYSILEAGENKEENEGSIITICRKLKPSKIYLFPSQARPGEITQEIRNSSFESLLPMLSPGAKMNNTEINAIAVEKYLLGGKILPELEENDIHIIPMKINDATDIRSIYSGLKKIIIEEVLPDFPQAELSRYDFCFNISSGTGQMHHVARVYFPASPIKVQFYQCKEQRFVSTPESRVILDDEPVTEEVTLLTRISGNVERYNFYSAAEDCNRLKEISIEPNRRIVADILAKTFDAYQHMDQMEYMKAYKTISSILNSDDEGLLQRYENMREIFETQQAFLENLKDEKEEESPYNLTDLYFNICRAFERKNYTDVLARFWRLREGMLYYRLKFRLSIDARNDSAGQSFSGEGAMRTITQYLIDNNDNSLRNFQNKWGKVLDLFRLARNHTFIAHGMLSVSKTFNKSQWAQATLQAALSLGEQILNLAAESEFESAAPLEERVFELVRALAERVLKLVPDSDPAKYPFTEKEMKRLIDTLIYI